MKRTIKALVGLLAVLMLLYGAAAGVGWLITDDSAAQLELDGNMSTSGYYVEIELGEDMSYFVTETIDVDMLTERHGIYRYLPKDGVYADNAHGKNVLYKVDLEVLDCSAPYTLETSGDNYVIRIGSEEETVYGSVVYTLTYRWTPVFQKKDTDFSLAYFNLFPMMWQNNIPAGAGFRFVFPAAFDHEAVRLYTGGYGSTEDAGSVLSLSWQGDTLTGVLTQPLALGSGITLYADMGEGYFTAMHEDTTGTWMIALSLAALAITAVLFWLLGRDEPIIPSVQFEPPRDLDSAAVGYVIDGTVDNKDVLSLILYWADKGYLTIEQTKKDIVLGKTKRLLPEDVPAYQKTLYDRLFEKQNKVNIGSFKYHFTDTLQTCKNQVGAYIKAKGGLYTGSSRAAGVIAFLLALVPLWELLCGVLGNPLLTVADEVYYCADALLCVGAAFALCCLVDKWHAMDNDGRVSLAIGCVGALAVGTAAPVVRYGMQQLAGNTVYEYTLQVLLCSVSAAACMVMAAFMKKRTKACIDWMGRLLGLRDFIENAELDRLKMLAEENPQWFYHVLPYTYVFGLSNVFAARLEEIALPEPDWYRGYEYDSFDYYYFNRMMMDTMDNIRETLTTPDPAASSNGSSGSGQSSSFTGSSGGFSGGGGGGGGGGSW